MKVFIVAVPLFDKDMTVKAYRLCDRSGERAIGIQNDFRRMTEALISPGLDLIEQIGIEPFAANKPLFADLNMYQLLVGRPVNVEIEPSKLICVLPGNIPVNDMVVKKCGILKEKGYQLGFEGLPEDISEHPLIAMVDYLILDYLDSSFTSSHFYARTYWPDVNIIFSNVPDTESFDRLASRNQSGLFTGGFYNRPITEGYVELSPVKINALQLLSMVNSEDYEFEEIVPIIERDPFLTVSLLRFINSAAIGLSNKVNSIMTAVTLLGQREIRRWANVAISISLAEDRPGEITKLALTRAKFSENLAQAFHLPDLGQQLFLAGLFSLLDIILQMPMEDALKEVALDEEVKRALLKRQGDIYTVLAFIFLYEKADWDQCSIMMIQNGVEFEEVNQAFVDACYWYYDLLDIIGR
ncbi:MAG: HDOD domain-containing protein [Clostridiales bacterium]|nr:HDOD domain-containing protein [Clostridiales bacterium]